MYKCAACPNIEKTTSFSDSSCDREFKITYTISFNTVRAVYCASYPSGLKYVVLILRKRRKRVSKHLLGISVSMEEDNI